MWPSWLKKSNPPPQPEEVVAQKMIDLAFCPRCQVQGLTVTRFRGGFEQGTAFCPVGHRARWQMRSGVMEVFGR